MSLLRGNPRTFCGTYEGRGQKARGQLLSTAITFSKFIALEKWVLFCGRRSWHQQDALKCSEFWLKVGANGQTRAFTGCDVLSRRRSGLETNLKWSANGSIWKNMETYGKTHTLLHFRLKSIFQSQLHNEEKNSFFISNTQLKSRFAINAMWLNPAKRCTFLVKSRHQR